MEDLIKQAFMQVDVLGPHVQEGHYDLTGPDGEIILPSVWEKVVQPDWAITMTMWPLDKLPPAHARMPMPGAGGGRRGHPVMPPHSGMPPMDPNMRPMGRPHGGMPGGGFAPPPGWGVPAGRGAGHPSIINVTPAPVKKSSKHKKAERPSVLAGFLGVKPPKKKYVTSTWPRQWPHEQC